MLSIKSLIADTMAVSARKINGTETPTDVLNERLINQLNNVNEAIRKSAYNDLADPQRFMSGIVPELMQERKRLIAIRTGINSQSIGLN